jgi:hypothetical protein
MTPDVSFTFRPRWKEELVCQCQHGSAILDMPMGIDSVYAPHPGTWQEAAPAWAAPLWQTFFDQLEAWCEAHHLPLYPGSGSVYFEPVTPPQGKGG